VLPRRPVQPQASFRSDELQIDGLRAALVSFDLEADALAFIQAAKARCLDGSHMDEYVLTTALGRDESETLCRVEKLDLSNGHYGFLLKALGSTPSTTPDTVVKVA
jgi:hypothetical protein